MPTRKAGTDFVGFSVIQAPGTNEELAERILKLLRDVGGAATVFEIEVRLGKPPDLGSTLKHLENKGLIVQRLSSGGNIIRLR